eukprot:6202086-Pleurochrysis_carterae.AAC.2
MPAAALRSYPGKHEASAKWPTAIDRRHRIAAVRLSPYGRADRARTGHWTLKSGSNGYVSAS